METLTKSETSVKKLIRCLSGRDWGASMASLLNIYQAIMRASLDA